MNKKQKLEETPSPNSQSTGLNGPDLTNQSKKRRTSKMTTPNRGNHQNPMAQDLQIKRAGQLTAAGIPPAQDRLEPPAFASDSLAESFGSRQNREMKVNMDDVMSVRYSFPDSGKAKNGGDYVIEMTQGNMHTERAMMERELTRNPSSNNRSPASMISRKKKLL